MSRTQLTNKLLLWTFIAFLVMLIVHLIDDGLAYYLQYFVLALVGVTGCSWLLEKW